MAQSDTGRIPPPFVVGNSKNSACRIVASSVALTTHQVASDNSNHVLQKGRSRSWDYPEVAVENREEEAEAELPKKRFIEDGMRMKHATCSQVESAGRETTSNGLAGSEMVFNGPSGDEPGQICGSPPSPPVMANFSAKFSEAAIVPGCRPLSPPPPPPPLPSPPLRRNLPPFSSSAARKIAHRTSNGQVNMPKEHVHRLDSLFFEGYRADVSIHTEDGGVIAAHSLVLASASPVFRAIVENEVSWPCRIAMPGVPYNAAKVFVRYLYSGQYGEREMEESVMQLLVLAHTYCVPSLKRICTQEFEQGLLTKENVADVLQMASLCDAPRLHLLCYRMIVQNAFKEVSRTEGWRVMCESNPELERELVEAVIESNNRSQERARKLEEDKIYEQLHEAMEALIHICRDGCHTIGPLDKAFDPNKQKTCNYPACRGLESLVRHFAGCKLKVSGGCVHCKRMWQLLQLHSHNCQELFCKVPLCEHFKKKMGQRHSERYELCWKKMKKVVTARKATSAFSLAALLANLDRLP